MAKPKGRNSRGVLLSSEGRVLLMRMSDPRSGRQSWVCPGGTAEDGESAEDCLRRELFEETGRSDCEIGPELWQRLYSFTWGEDQVCQDQRYFLVRTQVFEATMDGNPQSDEIGAFRGFRWWTVKEIASSSEEFDPSILGRLLADLVKNGPPESPIDITGSK